MAKNFIVHNDDETVTTTITTFTSIRYTINCVTNEMPADTCQQKLFSQHFSTKKVKNSEIDCG